MRWIVCLLIILLSGCHGVSLLERTTAEPPPPIMPLWESYQHCLAATDPRELLLIIEQFEHVVSEGAEPPSWMKAWGDHVVKQPLRTSVDPQALGAACTLRTAAVMAETEHLTEAQVRYQRVRTRYSSRDVTSYANQAREALAGLQDSAPAVAAFHLNRVLPH